MTVPEKAPAAPTHVYVVRAHNMTPILCLAPIVSMETRRIGLSEFVVFEVAAPILATKRDKPIRMTVILGETAFYDEPAALEAAKRLRKRMLAQIKRQQAVVDCWRPWLLKRVRRTRKRKTG